MSEISSRDMKTDVYGCV